MQQMVLQKAGEIVRMGEHEHAKTGSGSVEFRGEAEVLMQTIQSAVAGLERLGIEITPAGHLGVDEIAECVTEYHARFDKPALQRELDLHKAELGDMQ